MPANVLALGPVPVPQLHRLVSHPAPRPGRPPDL